MIATSQNVKSIMTKDHLKVVAVAMITSRPLGMDEYEKVLINMPPVSTKSKSRITTGKAESMITYFLFLKIEIV